MYVSTQQGPGGSGKIRDQRKRVLTMRTLVEHKPSPNVYLSDRKHAVGQGRFAYMDLCYYVAKAHSVAHYVMVKNMDANKPLMHAE